MAKNKNNGKWWKNPKNIFWWIILSLLVMILLYIFFGYDLFSVLTGGRFTIASIVNWLASILGGLGLTIGGGYTNPIPIPGITDCEDFNGIECTKNGFKGVYTDCRGIYPDCTCKCDLPCTAYHIGEEFRDYFGDLIIDTSKANCINNGGSYVEQKNELSCFFGHPADVVCDGTAAKDGKKLCDSMNAEWVCDNANGLYGCFCEAGGADIPEANPDKWECGEYYWNLGICSGSCPTGMVCELTEGNVLWGEYCGCVYTNGEPDGETSCSTYEITTGDAQTAAIQCLTHDACIGDDTCRVINNIFEPNQRYKCDCFDSDIFNSCSYFYNEDDCMSLGYCRGQTPFGDWYETNCGWTDDMGCHCPLII